MVELSTDWSETHDIFVIGAGQAGLSTSYHLRRLGLDHVVLDAEESPGGAWQHRWGSLTMDERPWGGRSA